MPDKPNFDDSLMPDWMRDWKADEDDDAESEQGKPPPAQPPAREEEGLSDAAPTIDDLFAERADRPSTKLPTPLEPAKEPLPVWLSDEVDEEATGEMPWLAEDAFEELPPVLADTDAALPDWLRGEYTPAPDQPPAEAEPPAPGVPDWVTQNSDEPKGGIRRIRRAAEPEPPAEKPPEDWISAQLQAGEPGTLPPDMQGLSYEEWEQRQIAQEREEKKTIQDRMLEEVPDWFAEIGSGDQPPESAEPPKKPSEPEFVPDWFMGLDEQNIEEAPDWFKQMDYAADPLSALLSETPPTPAESAEPDVPDWFKGIEAPAPEGVNWDALFGSSAPAEPPATPAPEPLLAEQPDRFAQAVPQDEELPLPDIDALAGQGVEPLPAKKPDWLAETPSGAGIIAEPEEVPFPELDLDQAFPPPDATPPAAPPEDFVERFEPLEPEYVPPVVDQDAPDWLREMGEDDLLPLPADLFGQQPPPEPEPPVPLLASEDLDWLQELSEADIAAEQTTSPEREAEGLFAPLDSSGIDALLGLSGQPPAAEPTPEPEWPSTWELPVEPEPMPVTAESEAVPEPPAEAWEMENVPDLEALFAEAESAEALPYADDFFRDAALADLSPLAETPAPPEPELVPEPPLPAESQPGWIAELRPTDLPVTLKVGGVEVNVKQKQVAELPDRLRALHDEIMPAVAQPPPAPPAPEAGPLAGISGVLPLLDLGLGAAQAVPTAEGPVITRQQQVRVERLQNLLNVIAAEEEEAEAGRTVEAGAAIARRARRRARFKLDRVLIAVLMLAAVVVPFATDVVHFAADPADLTGQGEAVITTLDRAVGGAASVEGAAASDLVPVAQTGETPRYVLFALEYGPTTAGELDPLVEAVLRDVLARGGTPLIISTNPAGAFHSQAILEPLREDARLLEARGTERLMPGDDYVLLSYLPGDMIGVRSLRNGVDEGQIHPAFDTNLLGEDLALPINNLDDLALIVVAGEDSEDIRTWAEQLDGVDVPKVALVTAAAEALARPYVNPDAYAGMLAGYRDTAAYYAYMEQERATLLRDPYVIPDRITYDLPNPDDARWHSTALGAAVAAGVIGLGMVVNLFRGLVRRRRG